MGGDQLGMNGLGNRIGSGQTATNLPPIGGNVFEQSSQAYTRGLNGMSNTMGAGATQRSMNQYLNPYQDQVVNNTVGRMRDQQAMDLNMVQGQAAQQGAFGGARHGLVESQVMDNSNRNMMEGVAGMNQQGFNTAAQFGQNRIGQDQNAAQGLIGGAPVGFNMGQAANAGLNQAGMQQQNLMQQILDQATHQYDTFQQYPQTSLATALAGVQGNPLGGAATTTSKTNNGLFDYLSLGAGMGSSYLGGK
tara:strand:- start:3102 stop:3845 length:744 start_codon:yes stop_codon:yes gene_type:complete